jgi:hypothetical protein
MKSGSFFLFWECIVKVCVDIVNIGTNKIDLRCMNHIFIDDFLFVDILNGMIFTQRLTIPRWSPLITKELLQNIDFILSP